MRYLRGIRSLGALPFAIGAAAALLLLVAVPASANILPESAIILHVQPVSGSCETPITLCDDIVSNSEAAGALEFLIFFQPIAWQESGEPVQIHRFHGELVWPDSWTLLGFDACFGYGGISAGPPYAIDVEWSWCPDLPVQQHGVALMARLVLNATEPGRLLFADSPSEQVVELGCPPYVFNSYPVGLFSEVALDCEWTHYDCGYVPNCFPTFADPALHLSALPGGSDAGQTLLTGIDLCWGGMHFETLADWAQVAAVYVSEEMAFHVTVTADATGLAPGIYETRVRAYRSYIARCMPVIFTVEDPTAVPPPVLDPDRAWGQIKALYR